MELGEEVEIGKARVKNIWHGTSIRWDLEEGLKSSAWSLRSNLWDSLYFGIKLMGKALWN